MNPTSFAPIDIPAKKVVKFQTKYLPQSSTEYEKKEEEREKTRVIPAYNILAIILLSISSALWS